MAKPQRHVFVCAQQRPAGHPRGCCTQRGGAEVLQAFWQELKSRNLYEQIAVTYSGCLGPCDGGANVLVYPDGVLYSNVTKEKVATIFQEHLIDGAPVESLRAPPAAW
ncbi:MAG: (2Fe-2S) ferredoxin domain-containing protein [Gammaproteobacteria bacterium]